MEQKAKRTRQKHLSLLLAAAIFLTIQWIPAQAKPGGAAKELPSNPVHHCTKMDDGTDYTEWSYVYFGNYPQTEVSGEALTAAITGAPYDVNGDAWVDGARYRRVSKSNTNYDGYFGDSDYRYFKWEPIKWRVLQNDGSTLFVIADRGLDCEDYNQEKTDITWEGSMLRDWLNSTFYHTAFSSGEQKAVVGQTAENEANPEYGTEDKGKANDKVTLLSMEDAANPSYGFCEEDGTDSATRRMEPSDYARARGTFISSGEHAGGCWWWLRSLGYDATYAVDVSDYGYILSYGSNISTSSNAVVPALHIDLASGLWSLADAESGAEGCAEHNWDKGVVAKAPTCKEDGEQVYTCTVCKETRQEAIGSIPHTYEVTVTKPTANKDGSIIEKCIVCGHVKSSKTIPNAK
ncbi:MAG: hypothetical protein HFH42_01100 [Lachnospiraceae bacterium]|nr:hypothetical protein [Lachnospiraceae bacterium]